MSTSEQAKFWTGSIVNAGSIIFSLFVLYCLISDAALRRALHNHVIIVLLCLGLIYEIVVVPWTLYRFWHDRPLVESTTFYLLTYFFDYSIIVTQAILFAWATIERHILIFHDQWLSTKRKRLVLHYFPIILLLIYCILFFVITTFAPFCENSYGIFIVLNILIPCVFDKTSLGIWDLFAHQVAPIVVIVVFSIALLLRILFQKKPANHSIQWRKYRKMTIQLLSISVLYFLFGIPMSVVIILMDYNILPAENINVLLYVVIVRTYVILLFPFVCCASLPELRRKLKRMTTLLRHGRVGIQENLNGTQTLGGQTMKLHPAIH
mgnify:CR=1 FL=1